MRAVPSWTALAHHAPARGARSPTGDTAALVRGSPVAAWTSHTPSTSSARTARSTPGHLARRRPGRRGPRTAAGATTVTTAPSATQRRDAAGGDRVRRRPPGRRDRRGRARAASVIRHRVRRDAARRPDDDRRRRGPGRGRPSGRRRSLPDGVEALRRCAGRRPACTSARRRSGRSPRVPTMPARHDVGAAERVELLHGVHGVVVGAEQRDLDAVDEGRGAALARQVGQACRPRSQVARRAGSGGGGSVSTVIARTSSVVPAMRTPRQRARSAVAGRAWPRSLT